MIAQYVLLDFVYLTVLLFVHFVYANEIAQITFVHATLEIVVVYDQLEIEVVKRVIVQLDCLQFAACFARCRMLIKQNDIDILGVAFLAKRLTQRARFQPILTDCTIARRSFTVVVIVACRVCLPRFGVYKSVSGIQSVLFLLAFARQICHQLFAKFDLFEREIVDLLILLHANDVVLVDIGRRANEPQPIAVAWITRVDVEQRHLTRAQNLDG
jgi:hypothetical protein